MPTGRAVQSKFQSFLYFFTWWFFGATCRSSKIPHHNDIKRGIVAKAILALVSKFCFNSKDLMASSMYSLFYMTHIIYYGSLLSKAYIYEIRLELSVYVSRFDFILSVYNPKVYILDTNSLPSLTILANDMPFIIFISLVSGCSSYYFQIF